MGREEGKVTNCLGQLLRHKRVLHSMLSHCKGFFMMFFHEFPPGNINKSQVLIISCTKQLIFSRCYIQSFRFRYELTYHTSDYLSGNFLLVT